jgi:hypothetical protein
MDVNLRRIERRGESVEQVLAAVRGTGQTKQNRPFHLQHPDYTGLG